MGIRAIMGGATEGGGALVEAWAAFQGRGGLHLIGATMGVVAAALLVAAGVSLLRRSPGAASLARGAAFTMIAVTALIGFVIPMMGVFAILVGIGYPLALLLFLRRGGGRGLHSEPSVA